LYPQMTQMAQMVVDPQMAQIFLGKKGKECYT
jgi:hypothetical protein